MAKPKLTKEQVVDLAYELAKEKGLQAVNVRDIASRLGVATGTIYNYFYSIDELKLAAIQKFFAVSFMPRICIPEHSANYVEFCKHLFTECKDILDEFQNQWLDQVEMLSPQTKQEGLALEKQVIEHATEHMAQILRNDPDAKLDRLPQNCTPEQLVCYTLRNLIGCAKTHESPETLYFLLENALY